MRVLFLSQGRKVEDQPDFDIAFRAAKVGGRPVEVRNIPFVGYIAAHGEAAFYREVLRQNGDFRPDLVFFQFYHSCGDAGVAECCRALKASANAPLVFGSTGDLFWTGWRAALARPLPKSAVDLAGHADAFFSTAFGNVADEFARRGARNLVFLPHAFCPAHFPYWTEPAVESPAHDVTMLGSRSRLVGRRPVATFGSGWRRRRLVAMLAKRFGGRLAVFGRGWGDAPFCRGAVLFDDQVRVFRDSRVVVDAPAPILSTDYYASDRPFFIVGSGTLPVIVRTPRLDRIFRDGEHAFFADSPREVSDVCERLLAVPDGSRRERAERMRAFVEGRHLVAHRVDTILSTAESLLRRRRGEITADEALRAVRMHHFLPEVDLEEEYRWCVRNWAG